MLTSSVVVTSSWRGFAISMSIAWPDFGVNFLGCPLLGKCSTIALADT